MTKKKLLIVGAGGHAKVVIEAVNSNIYDIVGILDKDIQRIHDKINDIEIIGTDSEACEFYNNGIECAVIAIGHLGDSQLRNKLFNKFQNIGFEMINIIHKTAVISENSLIGYGNVILAGVIVNSNAVINNNTIINTGAIVEHDVNVGNGVHLAPRTVIAGESKIGDNTFLGLGSIVIQGIDIGNDCIIGAGSTVINNLPEHILAVGPPARIIREV